MATEEYRLVSDSQWRYLHGKINDLQGTVMKLWRTMDEMQRPKRGLRYHEAVPPESACRDINSMLLGSTSYAGFMSRLAGYYGCEPMGNKRDDSIDPKYRAVYRPDYKTCYSRGSSVGRKTVLHEFFHHLVHLGVVFVDKKDEEDYAERYASTFLDRAGWSDIS